MPNRDDSTATPGRVLVGTDTKTRSPVYLPYADRDLGVALIGKAGTGKSTILEHMILADLEHGTPGMVIDPHGLLAQRVMELATSEQADRIILLEAVPSAPFGLNLLAVREPLDKDDRPAVRAVDSVVATIKKLYREDDSFLPRFERYLKLCARTLIPSRLTLIDVPRLFDDVSFRQSCLARVIDPVELQYLYRGWARYDRLRPGDQETHIEALVNRLEGLIEEPAIRQIIGSPETTVPFDRILDGDSTLLVSLPSDRLSPERCDFIGAMLLCALADLIFARRVQNANPPRLHILLDEYQRFATSTTSELLQQGRKYGAGVTMAHQSLQQIRDTEIRDASRHAGTLIVLGVTRPDAEQLAGEFPIIPDPEWVETIEEIDGTEPKYVLSPTPAEDIYVEKHSSDDVDLAARTLFKYYPPLERTEQVISNHQPEPRMPPDGYRDGRPYYRTPPPPEPPKMDTRYIPDDKRKSAGVRPRPGGAPFPEALKLIAPRLNHLLSQAQEGKLTEPGDAGDAIIAAGIFAPGGNFSPAWPVGEQPSAERMRRALSRVYKIECRRLVQECIRPWLIAQLKHPDDLLRGEDTDDLLFEDRHFAFSGNCSHLGS